MTRHRAWATLVALAAAACAPGIRVETDYDPAVAIPRSASFRTEIGTAWGNDLAEQRALRAVEARLEGRGWRLAAPGEEAAMRVVLHGATESRRTIDTFYDGPVWYGWGWRGWRYYGGVTVTQRAYSYRVGTLVVDIFDAGTRHVVWRGTAEGELAESAAGRREQFEEALARMFAGFPPAPAR